MIAPPQVPFALGTFTAGARPSPEPSTEPFPGLVTSGGVLDLREPLQVREAAGVLERWDEALPVLRKLAEDDRQPWIPLERGQVQAPLLPRQVFQSGANYRQHVIDLELAHRADGDPRSPEEARAEIAEVMDRRAAEGEPYVFVGLPSAITGPESDVVLPSWASKPDWELELAAVIGRGGEQISEDAALDHVAGYAIANDLTDRASVFRRDMPAIGTDWLRSKNAPGFTPLGPHVVPAEFVGDPSALRVQLRLNGETMQDESTSDMLFGVARIIAHISRSARLLPGDLVLTGSPAGNGAHRGRFLRDGDVLEGSITGLGQQWNRCVAG